MEDCREGLILGEGDLGAEGWVERVVVGGRDERVV